MKRAPRIYTEDSAGCPSDTVHDDIGKIILPGKFSAPRLDPRFHLFREKAMHPLLQAYRDHKRCITIAARAGQGKSILATQFIHHIGIPFVWIQIGPEDRSIAQFVQTLMAAFAKKFAGLKQTHVCHCVLNGQMDGESAEHEVSLLIDALRPYIGDRFYCILDDLHWILEANASKAFLNTLLRKAPREMCFILISRTPVKLPSLSTRNVQQIGNTDLALSRSEVATFLAETLQLSLSTEVVVDLHERTEGWLMGLLIAGHALANHHLDLKSIPLERISGGRPDQMFTYFRTEIESTLPPEQWHVVLMLSLLDQIPLELVQSLRLTPHINQFLEQLVQNNLQLRQETGNPYYTTATAITIGAVYIRLGHYVKARKLLDQAIERAHQMGAMWLCAGAHAQRAHLYSKTAQVDNAHADLRHFLRVMKTQGYLNCCGWHPELMQTLLHAAVVQGIEIAYACKLAQKRLKLFITTQGECIPLLEITTLGGFELRIKGKPPLDGTAFTKNQRALLALLFGADHCKCRLAGIQEEFWPNSASANNRTSLANLIARLRRTLGGYVAPYSVDHYVKVEKGYLHLRNCQVDAVDFEQTTAQANRHLERGQFWQADVSQLRAHGLYKGAFLPGVHLQEPSYLYREKLHCDYLTGAEQWSQMLAATGRFPEALSVSQKALAYDPTHESLVKIVYGLFIQKKDKVQAKKIFSNYASALQNEGYTEDEIDMALKGLSKLKRM